MVQQLSSLRVAPELDASKYTAGAQQKVAADKAMAASNREVAATAAQTDAKIVQSGDVLARLSRQFVDGYASAQRMNSALNSLSRGLDNGKIKMEQVGPILDGIYRKYQLAGDASLFMARGQTEAAAAVARMNAQLTAQKQIAPANNNASVAGSGSDTFRRTNLGYQAFDIGQGLAAGTPLAIIAAQQGPQIAQMYASQGGLNALLKDTVGILGGVARAAGPWIAALAAIYGAYRLIASFSAEASLGIDAATRALAAQAAPVDAIDGKIKDLVSIQTEYQKAITSTATAQDAASASIVASTEREFNAKRQLLELELKRQEASIKLQQSEMAIASLELRKSVGQQVFTRSDLERQGYADPRINGGIPFVRLPDDVTGLQKTQDVLTNNPLFDKIKELQANLQLTELGAERLREAVKKVFTDAGGVGGPTFAGGNIPIPQFRGVDDIPSDQVFIDDFGKSSSRQINDLQNQATALGLTGAALEEFTFKQQALNAALAQNLELGPDQVAIIEKQAKAYGAAAEALARGRLAKDLAFDRDQMFRSSQDQQIASRQQGAGLVVDLNSPVAQQMRDMAKFTDAKDLATGFLTDFKSELMRNGGDVGKALGTSILNALTKSMDDQLGKIFDTIATWLASAITGQRPGLAGATAFGTAGGFADMLGIGANDNFAPGAVTRAPLAAVGSGGVAAQAWNFFKSKGLADHQVAGVLGNISAESAFKPTAIGDGGNAFGLFQHNDRAPALLNAIGGKGNLGDVQGQLDFAWKELNSSESGALARLKAAPDVRSATAAFAGFERPRGFSLDNPEGADNFSGRLSGAEQALDKFGGTAVKVTDSLGGLDSSVTNTVQSLAGGIDGKGGLASILDGLKPQNFQANTTLSDILGYSGGGSAAGGSSGGGFLGSLLGFIPKLFGFAGGTDFAPGGLARINEQGGEIVDLPRGSRVIPHDVSMRMAANANRPSAAPAPKMELHVHVNGGSGDEHVRMLARQGAQEAIGEYHQGQVNGGFGDTQRRFTSQKG
ncbi:phage tail-type lysozyme domain-containing protein [Mesorhizobium sp. AD1-1]|uniref:phage tail tip lysozyme n=1 Tax=Mesorhizobium sp. AD1-1 TaxID=2876621 RepID=UPI001CCDB74F|nr:phage tail tip lysozyme [Mesorhizobium sp. AD1-1]MBZ9719096.1 phage tail-type lysozyme domain-containing protein [Mesorhizobium sp. AD1-1]